jgi:hypothetical protein
MRGYQQGGQAGFEAEPLPYPQSEGAFGLEHPFGYSMLMPSRGGGYSRPMHFEEGGPVSPYLPRKKIVLSPQEAAFCREHGIRFSHFARHKLESASP